MSELAEHAHEHALTDALQSTLRRTGGGPEFSATPSSGGLHPVRAHDTRLRTFHRISAAKYGAGGAVAAETDLGAVLETARVLLEPQGLRPVIQDVDDPGSGSVLTLNAAPCAPTPGAAGLAAAVSTRRSIRTFAAPTNVEATPNRPHSHQAVLSPASIPVELVGPTGLVASITLAPIAPATAADSRPERVPHAAEEGRATSSPRDEMAAPVNADALAAACCGQGWVAGAALAVLVTVPGELTRPAAWTLGAAATRVHLEFHAAGLGSCIVGALTPDAPQLWRHGSALQASGPASHLAVIAGVPENCGEDVVK